MQQETSLDKTGHQAKPVLLAVLMFLLGLVLTAFAVYTSDARIRDDAWYRFSLHFDRLDRSVRDQLVRPLAGLQGLAGMNAAHGQFDAQVFRDWVASQDMAQQYQGVLGFGYMERTTSATGDEQLLIRYLEPAAQNPGLIGQDANLEPALKAALIFITASGETSLAPMLRDAQGQRNRSEYLLAMPFYRKGSSPQLAEERKAALQGLVFARVDLNSLLLPSISIAEGLSDFEITDRQLGPTENLVFRSANVVSAAAELAPDGFSHRSFHNRRGIAMGARLLTLEAGSTGAFDQQIDHTTPSVVGVTGALLSALLAAVFWLVMVGRQRAENLAHRMTRDLDRMARVVRSTSHLVYVVDQNQKITWANEAFCRFAGKELADCIGSDLYHVVEFDADTLATLAGVGQAIDRREAIRRVIPLRRPGEAMRWFDVDLQIESDARGEYAGYVIIAADITQQQQAVEQVARAMRENQALLDAIDEHSIVSITDAAGTILYANEMFSRVSGYSRDELIGQNHRIVKSDQQDDAYWTSMWKTISSGYNWRDTVCNRAKDGSYYWVDTVVSPFFDETGHIERYISIRTDVTQALKAQVELRDERRHLQGILEGTNAGTWEWEVPTGRGIINQRWAEILGYRVEELGPLIMDTLLQHSHPEDIALARAAMERHFKGEADFFECEFRMRHREGHWVWVQSRGKVTSWLAPGKPNWVSGIHLDVTHQKKLQADLHRSNLVMQSIVDNIPMALSVFDANLNLIASNDKFNELLDFPRSLFDVPVVRFESLIRYNAQRGDYGPGDTETIIQETLERARHTVAHQFERERPNGVALEVRGAPMPGGGFITTYADITERRRAAAELARTTRMLQSVLDSASEVAVITIGLDETVTLFNKGAERMLGYSAEEMIGKEGVHIFFDPSEIEARASSMTAMLGRPVTGMQAIVDESVLGKRNEWTYIHKTGRRFIAALVVTALTDSDGNRFGYLGVSHDITQEKEHEARLQIAMEEAEQAATAKGQFLANMSHEIRTPMNAILGMLKLLQNTHLDPRQQDYASKTESAARSLLGLLNDILDFSKAEAGKMVLDPQPFQLDRLMRDLSVILSANTGGKRIEVLFDLDPALPAALIGDSLRLQQVLINLGGNAVKFTEQGEVVVSVALRQRDDDSATLYFAVRDSGIGIDPKHQQHIFSGFSQAEASTTRRFGGTGLGLSICRRLVALMGGELKLESTLGVGSTFFFTITLPVARDLNAAALHPHPVARAVLLVDDNAIATRVHAALGQSMGWDVTTAHRGEQALQLLQRRAEAGLPAFDAVFLDWHMPGMDGWASARAIRALPGANAQTLLIMVTADGRDILADKSQEAPGLLDGFLVKPVTASMLEEAVQAAHDKRHNPRKLPQGPRSRPRRLAGLRLLVVEDNLINQQVARELLGAEGAQIDLAANGQLGVEAVARARPPYDAVLMDIQMPVMDGYTAAVVIRNELGLQDLPIIAMTANAMASDREACLAAGMNDHIGKPFDVPQLVAMLCHHTGHDPETVLPSDAADMTAPDPSASIDPALDAAADAARASLVPTALLDIPAALALLGDNDDLYQQIAQAYLDELASVSQRLPALLVPGQLEEASRVLHTLKGLSMTVGAVHLGGVCRIGESQLKAINAGAEPDAAALSRLRSDLEQAMAQTRQGLEDALRTLAGAAGPPLADASAADTPLNRRALVDDLATLRGLLASSDMRAMDMHATLQKNHPAAAGTLAPLKAAVESLDFAQAVVQCDTFIKKFGPDN